MDGPSPITTAATATPVEHKVEIEELPHAPTAAVIRYRVWHDDAVLIETCRDPEFDACRALLAQGKTGRMTTFRRGGSTPCMLIDVERGAGVRTAEGAKSGPRLARWQPFDRFTDDAEGTDAE